MAHGQPPARPAAPELELVLDRTGAHHRWSPALDVVVPARNEGHRIGSTLEALGRALSPAPFSTRLTVVDNGSVDRTIEAVDRARTHGVPVRVISCGAAGKGVAVKTGVAAATAAFVGYVDADQSTPPECLVTAMAILQTGWDVVVGSRRALGAAYVVPQPLIRRVGSRAFNLGASTLVGRVTDTQCGMKVFRTAAARTIFPDVLLDGFAFDVEVIARVRKAGLRVMELPVTWSDSVGSSFRPVRDGAQAFGDLYRLRRRLRDPRAAGGGTGRDSVGSGTGRDRAGAPYDLALRRVSSPGAGGRTPVPRGPSRGQ